MHFIKKNIIIPLVVFIIGMSAVAGIVCSINNEQNKQNRTMANLNAMTYAERMKAVSYTHLTLPTTERV